MEVDSGWPCEGPLLKLSEDIANRLLPAFDTNTGMPYGTVSNILKIIFNIFNTLSIQVNLRHGVPEDETPVTCTAGVATFIVEFGALSRLTANPIYEEVAMRAMRALWYHKSKIGLVGKKLFEM